MSVFLTLSHLVSVLLHLSLYVQSTFHTLGWVVPGAVMWEALNSFARTYTHSLTLKHGLGTTGWGKRKQIMSLACNYMAECHTVTYTDGCGSPLCPYTHTHTNICTQLLIPSL